MYATIHTACENLFCEVTVTFLCLCWIATTRKCRVLDVVYNSSNNELVRTKTLVKNCIIHIDCTPFRQW